MHLCGLFLHKFVTPEGHASVLFVQQHKSRQHEPQEWCPRVPCASIVDLRSDLEGADGRIRGPNKGSVDIPMNGPGLWVGVFHVCVCGLALI